MGRMKMIIAQSFTVLSYYCEFIATNTTEVHCCNCVADHGNFVYSLLKFLAINQMSELIATDQYKHSNKIYKVFIGYISLY